MAQRIDEKITSVRQEGRDVPYTASGTQPQYGPGHIGHRVNKGINQERVERELANHLLSIELSASKGQLLHALLTMKL